MLMLTTLMFGHDLLAVFHSQSSLFPLRIPTKSEKAKMVPNVIII